MAEFVNRTLEALRSGPLGPLIDWIENYPRLAAWIFLAVGMNILVVIEARDVGLQPGQWVALIILVTLVAGAAIWIISWEDEDEESAEPPKSADSEKKRKAKEKADEAEAEQGSAESSTSSNN
ncbi:MAG: hypothetical protein GYB68_12145 [Chloroflexi bacterium]|nr:hypothetical protein [Chloroflexota bacterium]